MFERFLSSGIIDDLSPFWYQAGKILPASLIHLPASRLPSPPPSWLVKLTLILLCALTQLPASRAQDFLIPSDTFDRGRFITVAAGGSLVYGATVIGLNQAWYKGYDRSSFHFFNDWKEWNNMDKMGHLFTSYFETEISYRGCRWVGMEAKKSIWVAGALGIFYQSTVEFFDAYSARWGFSLYDMAYNIGGTGLFIAQQQLWKDQKIRMKVSSWPESYSGAQIPATTSDVTTTLKRRSDELFGTNFFERYLKDYNAQTIWISVNLKSFFQTSKLPPWLNLSFGYGSKNLYGGFANSWTEADDLFILPEHDFPRSRQWYLSPDLDFRKIKTKSPLLKTLFNVLNIFKVPAPTLEYSSDRQWKWHWLFL